MFLKAIEGRAPQDGLKKQKGGPKLGAALFQSKNRIYFSRLCQGFAAPSAAFTALMF
jgi:hypothetical protein